MMHLFIKDDAGNVVEEVHGLTPIEAESVGALALALARQPVARGKLGAATAMLASAVTGGARE